MSSVSTCLWFGKDAETAVRFYVSIIPDSRIDHILRSPAAWPGGEAGDVILIGFHLGGTSFQALRGGAPADYGMAASISVPCADQGDVDRLWSALTAEGGSEIMCGWLRDRWGIPGRSCRTFFRGSSPTPIPPFPPASLPPCKAW